MALFFLVSGISFLVSIRAALLADFFLQDSPYLIGKIGLQYSLNPGIAFGIQFPPLLQTFLILAALGFAFFLAMHAKTKLAQVAFGLIIGGGIANIIDRLMDGYVTDYFRVGSFPIFNVADSCISVGVALLLWEMVFRQRN